METESAALKLEYNSTTPTTDNAPFVTTDPCTERAPSTFNPPSTDVIPPKHAEERVLSDPPPTILEVTVKLLPNLPKLFTLTLLPHSKLPMIDKPDRKSAAPAKTAVEIIDTEWTPKLFATDRLLPSLTSSLTERLLPSVVNPEIENEPVDTKLLVIPTEPPMATFSETVKSP
jgi:hypothetical protein